MSVLNRKLRRELFAAKGVLAAIIGIIVIGISCFVSMASVYFNLEQSRRSYYAQCRMADFSVELKKVPLSELDRLNEIAGISEILPRITFQVTVDLEEVEKPLSGLVISLPAHPAPIINSVVLRRGGYFTGRRREEVIVNDAFARQHHIGPGDRIHLLLNNRRQELFVVGTAISSEFVYLLAPGGLVPDPAEYGVFYIKRRFAEEVFDFQGASNQVLGLLDPTRRDRPDAILRRIETRLEPFGVITTTPRSRQPSHWFLTNEINGLRVSVIILPTIFLSVAALILNVLMMRIAQQQRTVVGTLKAVGYGNRELFGHFLKFGTMIGLVGGVLGALLGYALAEWITAIYTEFFEFPRLVNRPYPLVILSGLAISVLFAVLGTLRGIRSVTVLPPAEAMRPRPPRRGRRILLERWRWLWRRLDFRWQMVLRGIFRQRMRTAAALFAAAVGAALILVTLYMRDAMYEMISFQFDKLLLSDFELSLVDERDYGALYEARHLPGVDYVEPVFTVACTFHHNHHRKQGSVTGILHRGQLTVPRDTAGNRVPVPTVGLLLTRKLADVLDVSAGDTLTIVPVKGLREPQQVPVTSIVDSYLGLAAYADFHYLNRLVGEEESITSLSLLTCPDDERTGEFYRQLKRLPVIQTVSAIRDQKAKMIEVLVDKMMVSIVVVIVFAGLIFFGSVLNASLISLAERTQEIAMLRALGYSPREVGVIFLRESLCLNVLGTLLGLPLGYWMSIGVSNLYNTELFRMPLVIQPSSWLVTVVLGFVFTFLAHFPVQRAINKMDWLAALSVKE